MKKRGIDKLFKDELEFLEGDFQVDHWAAMSAELDRRDRRKRRPIWIWLFLGVLLTGVTTAYFIGRTHGEAIPDTMTQIEESGMASQDMPASDKSTTPVRDGQSLDLPEENTTEEASLENKVNRSVIESSDESDQRLENISSSLETVNMDVQDEEINSAELRREKEEIEIAASAGNIDRVKVETHESKINQVSDAPQDLSTIDSASGKVQDEKEVVDPTTISMSTEIAWLDILSPSLNYKNNIGLNKSVIPEPPKEEQKDDRIFYRSGLGIYLSSEWYPYSDTDVQHFRGYAIGVQYNKFLDAHFNVSAGIGVRQMHGTFGATDESVQTVFNGFGWTRDFHSYRPNTTYYLEMPIYAGYTIGRHQWGLGVRMQKLMAIRAEHIVEAYDQSQLVNQSIESVNPISTRSSNNWVRSSAFNDIRAELALSYGFALAPGWSLHGEARYGVNGILINDDDQDLLREYKPLSASVRLNIKL